MTREEAEREAEKRNQHKSKYMADRLWRADHDSALGWHVRLGWAVETKWRTPA